MKPSEFYEKYWRIDGKPVPKLREYEKEWLDKNIDVKQKLLEDNTMGLSPKDIVEILIN